MWSCEHHKVLSEMAELIFKAQIPAEIITSHLPPLYVEFSGSK